MPISDPIELSDKIKKVNPVFKPLRLLRVRLRWSVQERISQDFALTEVYSVSAVQLAASSWLYSFYSLSILKAWHASPQL